MGQTGAGAAVRLSASSGVWSRPNRQSINGRRIPSRNKTNSEARALADSLLTVLILRVSTYSESREDAIVECGVLRLRPRGAWAKLLMRVFREDVLACPCGLLSTGPPIAPARSTGGPADPAWQDDVPTLQHRCAESGRMLLIGSTVPMLVMSAGEQGIPALHAFPLQALRHGHFIATVRELLTEKRKKKGPHAASWIH